MSDLPERCPPREMAVSAVGMGFAALLGCVALPAGPPAAAVAGAALTPYTTRMVELATAEWRRKSDLVAETAVATFGLGDEEFCARLSGNPHLLALAQKILWAASVSGNEHKLRTLGQLLGGTVKDRGDHLDEAQILAAALTELEAPHVAVLDALAGTNPNRERPANDPNNWSDLEIQHEAPMDPEFVLAALNTLTRHGLVVGATDISDHSGDAEFRLTKLGVALAEVMRPGEQVWVLRGRNWPPELVPVRDLTRCAEGARHGTLSPPGGARLPALIGAPLAVGVRAAGRASPGGRGPQV